MLNKGLRLRRLVLACVLVGRFLFLYDVALFCGLFVVDLYFSGDLLLFSVFGGDWGLGRSSGNENTNEKFLLLSSQ